MKETSRLLSLDQTGSEEVLSLHGSWRIKNLWELSRQIQKVKITAPNKLLVSGEKLTDIDTSGALLLFRFLSKQGASIEHISFKHFSPEATDILNLVLNKLEKPLTSLTPTPPQFVEAIGRNAVIFSKATTELIAFIGESVVGFAKSLLNPKTLRIKELTIIIERDGLNAIPICALVTFLIGVVVAYLFGIQIEKYGANIFIVDAAALAMCRELSPIIVAIIVAGRSGSAFTAQIGSMKLNEEIDALKILGLSPINVLVIPRVIALMITLPLLVFVGDLAGIYGSMLISDLRLGITTPTFIDRLQSVLKLKSFLVGISKAPVFAAVIAIIGCKQGLEVENNARSIGINTTTTVVKSIVAVILLNAAFAVIFMELGI